MVTARQCHRPDHESVDSGERVAVRPEERELDEEIRGHLAVSIQERMERGESPDAARMAALQELGYIPAVRLLRPASRAGRSPHADAALAAQIGLASLNAPLCRVPVPVALCCPHHDLPFLISSVQGCSVTKGTAPVRMSW